MSFFLTRYGLMVIALIVGMFGYQGWKVHVRKQAKQEVYTEAKELGKKNADAGKKNVERLNTDDKFYARELLRYCRDCKG